MNELVRMRVLQMGCAIIFLSTSFFLVAPNKDVSSLDLSNLASALERLSRDEEDEIKEQKRRFGKNISRNKWVWKSGKLETPDEKSWNKMMLDERVEFLQEQFKQTGKMSTKEKAILQERYKETLILMISKNIGDLIKGARSLLRIDIPLENFSNVSILFLDTLKTVLSKEYQKRFTDFTRLVRCMGLKTEKERSMVNLKDRATGRVIEEGMCRKVKCVKMKDCLIKFLGDLNYLLTPFFRIFLMGTEVGGIRVYGIFPTVFKTLAPKAEVTKQVEDIVDAFYLTMQLIDQTQKMLEMSS